MGDYEILDWECAIPNICSLKPGEAYKDYTRNAGPWEGRTEGAEDENSGKYNYLLIKRLEWTKNKL